MITEFLFQDLGLTLERPAVRETWVRSLGWDDPLEKGKAAHSSTVAWRNGLYIHGVAKSQTQLSDFHFTSLKETVSRGCRGTVTIDSGLRVQIILHLASPISCEDIPQIRSQK